MYYKEEIVQGKPTVFCRRGKDEEWVPLSIENLEKEFMKLRVEIERLKHKLEIESRRLHEPI